MSDYKIVIAQRGWVFVGKVSREGDQVVLTQALNVRRWGTEGVGLGSLALTGPTDATVLDYCGRFELHVLAIVGSIDCDDEVWRAVCGKYPAAAPNKKRSSR